MQAVRHRVRNISNVAETAATLGLAPRHKQCQIHLQVRAGQNPKPYGQSLRLQAGYILVKSQSMIAKQCCTKSLDNLTDTEAVVTEILKGQGT